MLAFVASVDPDLEGDDFRQHVRSLLPEWEHVRLNVYWSRNSCGVQLKLEEGYKDIYGGTFSFGRCPGDAFSKKLVAIAAAKMLALCLLYWLFSYLLISMCGLLYWKVLHGFALKVSLFFLCTTTNPGNHRQQAWYWWGWWPWWPHRSDQGLGNWSLVPDFPSGCRVDWS